MKLMSELSEDQLNRIAKRVDDILGYNDGSTVVGVRWDEAAEMLSLINATLPPNEHLVTIGYRMGRKVNSKDKQLTAKISGQIHYSDAALEVDGLVCYADVSANLWPDEYKLNHLFPVPQEVWKYVNNEAEPEKLFVAEVEKTAQVKYLGDAINISGSAKILEDKILDTPKNREHYGIISYKGKVYKPKIQGYHSTDRQWHCTKDAKLRVGVEIEKEKKGIRKKLSSPYLKERFFWCAETDGSLNEDGYELISPVYDLTKLTPMFKDLEDLREYIDSEPVGERAGGHINVSVKDLPRKGRNHGSDVFELISGFACMLYAMYPKRVGRDYSRAKEKKLYIDEPGKCAFYPKEDRLEIRIFPEVESVEDLKNRLRLVKYMLQQSTSRTDVVVTRMFNPSSNLHKLLKKMGFNVPDLAQKTLEYSAKIDKERFDIQTHQKLSKLGVKIQTQAKRSAQEKIEAISKFKELSDSIALNDILPMVERYINENDTNNGNW